MRLLNLILIFWWMNTNKYEKNKRSQTKIKKKKFGKKSNLYNAINIFNRFINAFKNALKKEKKHAWKNRIKMSVKECTDS